jgi:alkanesulfonate monooxygenase SsuD/methylene tetrahydromethanopterin reductase-like flavin-dependent oxidoreductase (luciferase family)
VLKLSVLDQSVAASGRSQDSAIRQTLNLAQQCEAWGYHRFWVSEHHSHPSIVGTAPEVLMAAVAARTTRIRLGSAGVMLPHYSPLKVAEQFRVLDALAPGRIDLGVGRAPGSDGRTAQLLNPDRHAADNFPQQVMALQAWVTGEPIPAGHPGHGVYAYPSGATSPDVWITEGQGLDNAFNLYRANYRPNDRNPQPRATVCVWALAADTEDEAWRLFQSRARWKMDRNTGRIGALLPPEQAAREYNASEQVALAELRAGALVGSAPQVADKLRKLTERLQLDEMVIITWTHEPAAQARSYELLAQEFALA